jgi:hypothetical protein
MRSPIRLAAAYAKLISLRGTAERQGSSVNPFATVILSVLVVVHFQSTMDS